MAPSRRKKWTEAEERTLIDKYSEMACDGSLAKMRTREKKYKPIALYVNSIHHSRDSTTYPWLWTWKDVSTKVQNMRHQYTLVKQKVKKSDSADGDEEFDWVEGLTHWSNFLRYKDVFGDISLLYNSNDSNVIGNNENGGGFGGSSHTVDMVEFGHMDKNGDFGAGMGLEFDYDAEEGDENYTNNDNSHHHLKENGENGFVYEDMEAMGSDTRKKRKILKGMEKRAWGFLANQLKQLRKMEIRFEQREVERENERQRREKVSTENEEEREKARREKKDTVFEREWEERMSRRRCEWKKRVDETLSQHRVEMGQIQTRILHEQQNLTNQLLGIVSQWTGQTIADQGGASNHYLSQMMQNLHHVNGIVHEEDTRVEGDSQDDQFIVDG